MTNDRRMLLGPSDEEIREWLTTQPVSVSGGLIWNLDLLRAFAEWFARWGAQTEYDAINGPFSTPCPWCNNVKRHAEECQVEEFVRSSRRTRGRVVEGEIAYFPSGSVYNVYLTAGNTVPRYMRVVPCRIEILDAPEEG